MERKSRSYYAIIFSAVFLLLPLLVHIVFSVSAPCSWMEAKWAAGDFLAYIGTVSLGIVAIWQNKKLREENDIAQKRLTEINQRANEQNAINIIVEYEQRSLRALIESLDNFTSACDPASIAECCIDDPENELNTYAKLASPENDLDEAFFKASRNLKNDMQLPDDAPIKTTIGVLYAITKKLLATVRTEESPSCYVETLDALHESKLNFLKERERYIAARKAKLNSILFGDGDLNTAKRVYC